MPRRIRRNQLPATIPTPRKPPPYDPTLHVRTFGDSLEFNVFPDARPQLIEQQLVVGASPRGDMTILTLIGSPQPLLVYQPYEEVRRALTRRF